MNPFKEFCKEEAKYRVCDELNDYEGYDTIKEYLEANGEDVDMFIENLAEKLLVMSEAWINSDTIDQYMFDEVDKLRR